jgi:hypothetical protein
MEKTIFLFQRKRQRSPADFARHYIEQHAPLGARLTQCLLGYTVNIVSTEGGPDAITEHWLPAAMDLLTPDKAYATREHFEAVVADDRSLFDSFQLYVIVEETYPIPGEPLDTPLGQVTPETKLVWMYQYAEAPPPPAGARRVVDNHVGYKLVYEGKERKRVAPDFQLIRMAWAPSLDSIGSAASEAILVKEHRFIPAPRWESSAS